MGRTWTQAPSNLPSHLFLGQGNLTSRPRFLQTLCLLLRQQRSLQPWCWRTPFPDRRVGFTPPLRPAACAAHLGLAGLYDPSDTLKTGIPIPGARTSSFASARGWDLRPHRSDLRSLSCLETAWALRPQLNPVTTGTFVPHPALIATAGAHRALYL